MKNFLNIAGVIIEFKSSFRPAATDSLSFRYVPFLYKGKKQPDIKIKVSVTDKLPLIKNARLLFHTNHPQDNSPNWSMYGAGERFILKIPLAGKEQIFFINKDYNLVDAYVLNKKERPEWDLDQIIYDALQIILIGFLAKNNGFIVHSMGLRDGSKKGYLFTGISGSGKSTLARIWHNEKQAKVLNDDRVAIRSFGKDFYIYATPWHGDFKDYMATSSGRAVLNKIFFINKARYNEAVPFLKIEAFNMLMPNVFFPFWDKKLMGSVIGNCNLVLGKTKTYKLYFKKSKSVIEFIRNLNLEVKNEKNKEKV